MSANAMALRRGFTLIETACVVAVLGALLWLLLASIHHTRERANVAQCENNLRQVALALHQHHDVFHTFPSNGGWDGKQTILSTSGRPITVYTRDLGLKKTFFWGVGAPDKPVVSQTGSWLYSILPYVEREGVYRERQWDVPIGLYICPSRRVAQSYAVTPEDAYGAYQGGGWSWAKADYAGNASIISGLVKQKRRNIRANQVTDGLSSTILAGEKAIDPSVHLSTTWYWDEPYFLGGSGSTARAGTELLPDAKGNAFKRNWGAAHSGGVVFALADGSTRRLAYHTASKVMASLLTPNGDDYVAAE